MKKMKKLIAVMTMAMLLTGMSATAEQTPTTSDVPNVIATMFPVYDITRAVAGDKVNLTMLMPVGVECHTFEPTPADIIAIGSSDLFIYTGEHMEVWAKSLLDGIIDPKFAVLDVSQGVHMSADHEHDEDEDHDHEAEEAEHVHDENCDHGDEDHDHEAEEAHDHDEDHDDHDHASEGHVHEVDPHIWTDPLRVKIMAQSVCDALCALAPQYEAEYRANTAEYLLALDALDADIREVVANAKHTDVVYGGRFAQYYFFQTYGLNAVSAYDSCSTETEPSVRQVLDLIKKVQTEGLPVVYYEELTDPKVARTIAEETGAELLLMHTCHNVSREEWAAGETYLTLMRKNLENLKKGLGVQ